MTVRLVAVGHLVQREGLRAMLAEFSDFEVVARGPYESGPWPADVEATGVVVIDVGGSPAGVIRGLAPLIEITELGSAIGVLVLSEEPVREVARILVKKGIAGRGYLLHHEVRSIGELAAAIRRVAAGQSAISAEVALELVGPSRREDESPLSSLTGRENEVLAELATGKTNVAIAKALGITRRTVERHLGVIYPKLGLQRDEESSPRVAASLLYLRVTLALDRAADLQEQACAVRSEARLAQTRRLSAPLSPT